MESRQPFLCDPSVFTTHRTFVDRFLFEGLVVQCTGFVYEASVMIDLSTDDYRLAQWPRARVSWRFSEARRIAYSCLSGRKLFPTLYTVRYETRHTEFLRLTILPDPKDTERQHRACPSPNWSVTFYQVKKTSPATFRGSSHPLGQPHRDLRPNETDADSPIIVRTFEGI